MVSWTLSGGERIRAHLTSLVDENTLKLGDLVENVDCYNNGMRIRKKSGLNLADKVERNLKEGYKTRMQRLVNEKVRG